MRPLLLIVLAALLAAGRLAGAQTLDDARLSLEKKVYEKARLILEKLAAQGNTEAEVRLAEMYVRPIGIPRNTTRGMMLYETASKKGNPEALFVLATELATGGLIIPDKKRAVSLLSTSAKLKYADAQFALCTELSAEESKYYDAVEAYAWCETLSKKKHQQASAAARRAKETMAKIKAKQGAEGVQAAEFRAIKYTKAY
jgi:TPR repeat protein